ncbi:MAG: DUF4422 domain-containing protein [Actinomycetaceae bacterium]|nr:DUF4422 domain-containing protein [Actinomycetaceae bacterium]
MARIVIAAHKPYWTPEDSLYLPVHVGAANSDTQLNFQRDDEGENISASNPRYSELTALYWAWKNLKDEDALGLAHYRRHFAGRGERGVLSGAEAAQMLERCPIILPKKRNYYIETVGNHYAHTFDAAHLDVVRDVLGELSPESLPAYEKVLSARGAHIFNMMLMRRDLFDEYCSWLFPILFEVEKRLDFEGMTAFEARVVGRLSELLIDAWLNTKGYDYIECPVMSTEKTNWLKKGGGFLAAKFLGRRYTESF